MSKKSDTDGGSEWLDSVKWKLLKLDTLLNDLMTDGDLHGGHIMQITIKGPAATGDGFLCILKHEDSVANKMVAFHSAADLVTLQVTLLDKLNGELLKWREDKPYPKP